MLLKTSVKLPPEVLLPAVALPVAETLVLGAPPLLPPICFRLNIKLTKTRNCQRSSWNDHRIVACRLLDDDELIKKTRKTQMHEHSLSLSSV